jgi:hypothetical protein
MGRSFRFINEASLERRRGQGVTPQLGKVTSLASEGKAAGGLFHGCASSGGLASRRQHSHVAEVTAGLATKESNSSGKRRGRNTSHHGDGASMKQRVFVISSIDEDMRTV